MQPYTRELMQLARGQKSSLGQIVPTIRVAAASRFRSAPIALRTGAAQRWKQRHGRQKGTRQKETAGSPHRALRRRRQSATTPATGAGAARGPGGFGGPGRRGWVGGWVGVRRARLPQDGPGPRFAARPASDAKEAAHPPRGEPRGSESGRLTARSWAQSRPNDRGEKRGPAAEAFGSTCPESRSGSSPREAHVVTAAAVGSAATAAGSTYRLRSPFCRRRRRRRRRHPHQRHPAKMRAGAGTRGRIQPWTGRSRGDAEL